MRLTSQGPVTTLRTGERGGESDGRSGRIACQLKSPGEPKRAQGPRTSRQVHQGTNQLVNSDLHLRSPRVWLLRSSLSQLSNSSGFHPNTSHSHVVSLPELTTRARAALLAPPSHNCSSHLLHELTNDESPELSRHPADRTQHTLLRRGSSTPARTALIALG